MWVVEEPCDNTALLGGVSFMFRGGSFHKKSPVYIYIYMYIYMHICISFFSCIYIFVYIFIYTNNGLFMKRVLYE